MSYKTLSGYYFVIGTIIQSKLHNLLAIYFQHCLRVKCIKKKKTFGYLKVIKMQLISKDFEIIRLSRNIFFSKNIFKA